MSMTDARRNEIAWLILVDRMKEDGLGNLKPNEFQRRLGSAAKKTGIPIEEAKEFSEKLIRPLIDALFADPITEKE